MRKPVKIKSGIQVEMLPVYGDTGNFADSFMGDIYVRRPNPNAINPRARKLFTVAIRWQSAPFSYHKSESAALLASRRAIRAHFNR